VTYGAGGAGGIGGEASLSITGTLGQSSTSTKTFAVGAGAGASFQLPAGHKATARLKATKGELTVTVEYEADLWGQAIANYGVFSGRTIHMPINNLLRNVNKPLAKTITQTYKIGTYFDGVIEIVDDGPINRVTDQKMNNVIKTFKAKIENKTEDGGTSNANR
jgi:hypothetical protein